MQFDENFSKCVGEPTPMKFYDNSKSNLSY